MKSATLKKSFGESLQIGSIFVSIGSKGSGKSSFAMTVLKQLFHKNAFRSYHLVLPSFKIEANNSYDWILPEARKHPNTEVVIYTGFDTIIIDNLVNRNRNLKTKVPTMLLIDDATSFSIQLHNQWNENLLTLISQSRL